LYYPLVNKNKSKRKEVIIMFLAELTVVAAIIIVGISSLTLLKK